MNFKKTTRKIRHKRIHTELTAHATISPGKVYFYIQNLSAMLGSLMHTNSQIHTNLAICGLPKSHLFMLK